MNKLTYQIQSKLGDERFERKRDAEQYYRKLLKVITRDLVRVYIELDWDGMPIRVEIDNSQKVPLVKGYRR